MSASFLESAKLNQNNFEIAGLVPFSTVDYPGKLAAVLFMQGCRWRCQYCHNKHLWPFSKGSYEETQVFEFLQARRELLDAVVISGGEPLWQRNLPLLVQKIIDMGFVVAMHTGGGDSACLKKVIASLSWIGLDYKIDCSSYDSFTHCLGSGAEFRSSLDQIQSTGVAFEARTTVDIGVHNREILLKMAEELHSWGVDSWVLQVKRELNVSQGAKTWVAPVNADLYDLKFLNQLRDIVGKLEVRG